MIKAVLFDVVGTLFDVSALDAAFERAFGDATSRKAWFAELLQSAFMLTILGEYAPFKDVASAALDMTAAKLGRQLPAGEKDKIIAALAELPAFPDVKDGLVRLQTHALRVAALTNSSRESVQGLLRKAGLEEYFEASFSTDEVRRFKPASETYHLAAERLGLAAAEIVLVAAHGWDLRGAMHAGCRAGFLMRKGMVANPLGPQPDFMAADLPLLAEQIIRSGEAAAAERRAS